MKPVAPASRLAPESCRFPPLPYRGRSWPVRVGPPRSRATRQGRDNVLVGSAVVIALLIDHLEGGEFSKSAGR